MSFDDDCRDADWRAYLEKNAKPADAAEAPPVAKDTGERKSREPRCCCERRHR
jgi:hypothetical protein